MGICQGCDDEDVSVIYLDSLGYEACVECAGAALLERELQREEVRLAEREAVIHDRALVTS